jgi:hypothetical protein
VAVAGREQGEPGADQVAVAGLADLDLAQLVEAVGERRR